MNKEEFLLLLGKKLSGLSKNDIDERLTFYSEMIDDRIEEGLSEEEAVSAVGNIDEIVAQIIADFPLKKIAKERIKPKKHLRVWEIILLILGSPLWLSILIAVFAVIFSIYASLWAVIISLWAVFASLTGCAFGGIIAGITIAFNSNILSGIALIGVGTACVGLSIFMFYGYKAITKGIFILTKKIALMIKQCFINKEEA